MIVYLDASALVKNYVTEAGTAEVRSLAAQASLNGTSLISRAELSAALAKAARVGAISQAEALTLLELFRQHWASLFRLRVDETCLARADMLAWEYGLRGYDAVHLASALLWQEALDEPVTMATFDRQLWEAAQRVGLAIWPPALD